jgi:hypothetical protein
MNRLLYLAAGLAALVLLSGAWLVRADDKKIDPHDQSGVPLEKQPSDPALKKIVLVAGRQSHGPGEHEFFAGCALLMKLLQETPGVFPVMARDGWPKDPRTFENAKSVVFYMDGGGGHPILNKGHKEVVQKLIDDKAGFVNLHYAVEYPKSQSDHVLKWLGGYYETAFSTNPHWDADFTTLPKHPITRGVKPFKINDEWYFNIRFKPESKDVTPILQATPPDSKRGTAAAAGRSASPAGTRTRTGPTRTSAGWWSTPSCGRPASTSPKTARKWRWNPTTSTATSIASAAKVTTGRRSNLP